MTKTRQPSALKHGLQSLHAREQCSGDVISLAEAILGETPPNSLLREAAAEAAEAILYLRRVQQRQLLALESGTLRRAAPTAAERLLALELSDAVKHAGAGDCDTVREKLRVAHKPQWILDLEKSATFVLELEFCDRSDDLRRLSTYERRAISRRRKALRRFDYERIEVERRATRERRSTVPR
ncbi:hypothetical protein [Aestuariivirga sp.]|uniref:hypothetical protein n=1 Tax=Aestuariivirga sp. TaxID=2650926 RepID=UPI003BA90DFB